MERRGTYCVMKCFELMYLLCVCQGPITDPARKKETRLIETAEAIQAYLTAHLNEKLTISELSRRFHLSPTACKNCFRACFGQSIHHWLLTKRLEVASELLTHSTLSILQIAQNDSPALSEADVGIAISDGAALAREIADITISAEDLWELVKLRLIAQGLLRRLQRNYRFVIGFNGSLIGLGLMGVITPATSAALHNLSTLAVSLHSMTALPEEQQIANLPPHGEQEDASQAL